jgi:uncharacterized protein YycO
MKQIYVGFSRPTKWFVPYSWLIRWVDKTPYSHVYIKFYSTTAGEWLIYQASHTSVNFFNERYFVETNIVVDEFVLNLDEDDWRKALKFAIQHVGAPYGVKQVVGIALNLLFNWNPFKDGDKSYVCSELIQCMIDLPTGIDPDEVRPIDIHSYLEMHNG